MVSYFLCCRCFGSLLFTTCVLLGSFVIYINLLFIDKKKRSFTCKVEGVVDLILFHCSKALVI